MFSRQIAAMIQSIVFLMVLLFFTAFSENIRRFNNTKNLLYVSCSRSIKNLRILYLNDVAEFKDGLKSIFGEMFSY